MKRLSLILIFLSAGIIYVNGRDIGDIEPVPTDSNIVQISDMKPVTQYELTKAYYRKVKLPDGSKVELKSRILLTDKQWQELAQKVYESNIKEEINPEICPHCGRSM